MWADSLSMAVINTDSEQKAAVIVIALPKYDVLIQGRKTLMELPDVCIYTHINKLVNNYKNLNYGEDISSLFAVTPFVIFCNHGQ
jgi:hypothetical protein